MQLDEVPGDGQAQPQPAVAPGGGPILLPEALEDVGQEVRADPDPVVFHHHLHLGVDSAQANADHASPLGELHGVGEQAPEDLPQAIGVARDQAGRGLDLGFEPDLLGVGRGAQRVQDRGEHAGEVQRLHVQPQAARHDAGGVQHVGDEP